MMGHSDFDGAIEKFTLANQKGPHFANPLEMGREALMAMNQSHLALAKFSKAEKYAPNCGRLHMKWSEALTNAGRKDEAQAQYQNDPTGSFRTKRFDRNWLGKELLRCRITALAGPDIARGFTTDRWRSWWRI
jgi:hypothetical protein